MEESLVSLKSLTIKNPTFASLGCGLLAFHRQKHTTTVIRFGFKFPLIPCITLFFSQPCAAHCKPVRRAQRKSTKHINLSCESNQNGSKFGRKYCAHVGPYCSWYEADWENRFSGSLKPTDPLLKTWFLLEMYFNISDTAAVFDSWEANFNDNVAFRSESWILTCILMLIWYFPGQWCVFKVNK